MTPPDSLSPDDRRFAALLSDALGATAGAAPAEVDAARVAAHFDLACDEALLAQAADDPALAALLADVALVREGAPLREGAPRLAGDAAAAPARAPAAVRSLAAARRRGVAWRVAAAVLVVAAPLALLLTLSGRSAQAGPLLALERIERRGSGGALEPDGPRALRVGTVLEARSGERWALGLAGGGRVVVGDGDVLRVACDVDGAPACARAVLALDAGTAVVAAPADGGAGGAVLLTPDGGRLEVVAGAAHVERRADGGVVLSLRDDGVARWTPAGAQGAREIVGPSALVLAGDSASRAAARDAETLFRDLAFFGGERTPRERRVSARAWNVLTESGDARARPSESGGAPALRWDLAAGGEARLSWTPDAEARGARSLRVLLRLRSARADATGTPIPDTVLPSLRVSADGLAGADARLEPPAEHDGRPVGTRVVVLSLPDEFRARPVGVPLVLVLRAERAAASVWFEGASFSPTEASAGTSSQRR